MRRGCRRRARRGRKDDDRRRKTSSHGFADLSITAHVTETQRKDGSYSETGKRTARTIVKYDGKSYGIDMFRDFWYSPAARKRFK